MRLAEGAAGAAGSLAPALGTLPALLLATLALALPALAGYYALRSFLRAVRCLTFTLISTWDDCSAVTHMFEPNLCHAIGTGHVVCESVKLSASRCCAQQLVTPAQLLLVMLCMLAIVVALSILTSIS